MYKNEFQDILLCAHASMGNTCEVKFYLFIYVHVCIYNMYTNNNLQM